MILTAVTTVLIGCLLSSVPVSHSQYWPFGPGPSQYWPANPYDPYLSANPMTTPFGGYGPGPPAQPAVPAAPSAPYQAPAAPSAPATPAPGATQYAGALGAVQGGPSPTSPTITPAPQATTSPTIQIVPVPISVSTQAPVTILAGALGATAAPAETATIAVAQTAAPIQIAVPAATAVPVTLAASALSATQPASGEGAAGAGGNVAGPPAIVISPQTSAQQSQPIITSPVSVPSASQPSPVVLAGNTAQDLAIRNLGRSQIPVGSSYSLVPLQTMAFLLTSRPDAVPLLRT